MSSFAFHHGADKEDVPFSSPSIVECSLVVQLSR